MNAERCELTELIKDQCAHCRGVSEDHAPKPMSKTKRAEALAVEVEDLLRVMNTAKVSTSRSRIGGTLPLRHFDRAEPFTLPHVTHADLPDLTIFRDAQPWDLPTPFDAVSVTKLPERGALHNEDLVVRRFRTVRRPHLPLEGLSRYLVEASYLAVDSTSGVAYPSLRYYGANTRSEPWRELIPRDSYVVGKPTKQDDVERQILLNIACGMQLSHDYSWRVHLKYVGADIGVMIPTTPSGVRALFRLRDYEPGASRRSALVHWVKKHSRRSSQVDTADDLVWVREHLRGHRSFTWQDMKGTVYPSGYDLRRLAGGESA